MILDWIILGIKSRLLVYLNKYTSLTQSRLVSLVLVGLDSHINRPARLLLNIKVKISGILLRSLWCFGSNEAERTNSAIGDSTDNRVGAYKTF